MIKILYSHLNVSGTDYKMRPQWFDFEKRQWHSTPNDQRRFGRKCMPRYFY